MSPESRLNKSAVLHILILLLSPSIFFTGCDDSSTDATGDNNEEEENLDPRSFYAGVSGLIPKNYPEPSDSDWEELFDLLPEYGE